MATLLEYECPSCGGAVQFDPNSQKVKCPFCDSSFDLETIAPKTERQEAAPEENWQESEQVNTYVCQSCGGEILCQASTAATSSLVVVLPLVPVMPTMGVPNTRR